MSRTVIDRNAVLSDDGTHRYVLTRSWGAGAGKPLCFLMLNPSTADATNDDPTIRKCMGFARRLGFPSIIVVNLFAFRAAAPQALHGAKDPVGPLNDDAVLLAAKHVNVVCCAWGSFDFKSRSLRAGRMELVRRVERLRGQIFCLGTTKSGDPRHPSRLSYATDLEPWGVL